MGKLKNVSDWPGYRKQKKVASRGGTLVMWDAFKGAPMKVDGDGNRWVLEHMPEGRGKSSQMWFSSWRAAQAAFTELTKAKPTDAWGFWPTDVSPPEFQDGGGVPAAAALPPPRTELEAAMHDVASDEETREGLRDLMFATREVWTNTKEGPVSMGMVPDYPTRVQGWKLYLSYRYGLPVQTKEEKILHETTDGEVMARLVKNPGYRRGMELLIQSINQQEEARKRQIGKKSMEVEAEAELLDADG